MTDRLKGFVVTLEQDIRADDAEPIIAAIKQIRGVASVTPSVTNVDDLMNRERIRLELHERLFEALRDRKRT